MITGPLDLRSRLSPPPRDLDFFAWVNVGVIVLFFALLGSRFVLAPGLPVGLEGGAELALPVVGTGTQVAAPASVVVSYRRNDVILFEGGKYTLAELRGHMELYAKQHPGAVMLVRNMWWVELVPLGVTLIVAHLVLLFWEMRYISGTLAFPGLKPEETPNPYLPSSSSPSSPSSPNAAPSAPQAQ